VTRAASVRLGAGARSRAVESGLRSPGFSACRAHARAARSGAMSDFESIHNHYERAVFEEVLAQAARRRVEARLLADIACVALNQLPPRYIRHDVDFNFYLTAAERQHNAQLVRDAVSYAFDFVVARTRMRLPRNGPQTATLTRVARRLVARGRAGG
jgi:hypothetical protein